MTREEAKQIVKIEEKTFDIEDTMFGDGSKVIQIADTFDDEKEAKKFLEALKLLCS